MPFLDLWQSWLWFAGVSLGLATALSTVVYMLSELLQNDKMKGWAKMELTEVVYSAIIISMAMFGLPLIDAVVQGALLGAGGTGVVTSYYIPVSDYSSIIQGTKKYEIMDICGAPIASDPQSVYNGVESCHLRLGIWYLREIFDETKSFAFDVYLSYIKTSMIAEFTINIEFLFEKAGFFTFTPWRGFYTIGNKIKELAFDWAIKIMMLTKFQEVLLRFIATALFPALFVIGAMLRTFTFTRRLGGLLIAMAITLYFIYPAFYAFGALIMLDIKNNAEVRSAWEHSEANPCAGSLTLQLADCPDPPIANSMYILNMSIYMIGGGQTGYNASEARDRLRNYEGIGSRAFYEYMEQGRNSESGEAMMPLTDPNTGRSVDLSSTTSRTERETNDSLARARQEGDNWFGAVSKESKLDKFVNMAWSPNGPIETLSRITFWSMFFSLFSIIGSIAAIRSLSITFGGDIEIAGLTRLI